MENSDYRVYAWSNMFKLTIANQDKVIPTSINIVPTVDQTTGEVRFFVDPTKLSELNKHGQHAHS
ncbi:MAG TPA: hypothetical protein DCW31_11930 [Lactobacillus sp.]|nr:hypothetical protein [Lactobacillus sp.]